MKKITLFLIQVALCFTTMAQWDNCPWQYWRHFQDESGFDLNSVSFSNTQVGFLASEEGVWKSVNSGLDWEKVPQFGNNEFYYSHFITEQVGFLAGPGYLYRTSNGGDSWANVGISEVNFTVIENSKRINGTNVVFALGDRRDDTQGFEENHHVIYMSTDEGSSWTEVYLAPGFSVFDNASSADGVLFFLNAGDVYEFDSESVSGPELLYEAPNLYRDINDIHFVSSTEGWMVEDSAYFHKTVDGGDSWSTYVIPGLKSYTSSIVFTSELNGYALGNYDYQTADGGVSWVEADPIGGVQAQSSYFFNDTLGIQIGKYGFCTTYEEILPEELATGIAEFVQLDLGVYPNPSSDGVFYSERYLDHWSVWNSTGELINEGDALRIDLSDQHNGVYFLMSSEGRVKLVK
jgi:photosystem II stability/assembly factor-like uncharacterized protein